MNRTLLVPLAGLCLAAAWSAMAGELPRPVALSVAGLALDCQLAKQPPPAAGAYVLSMDLDGDGMPDHIIDMGKGCPANRALYCNAEGCSADVYLSSTGGLAGSLKAQALAVAEHDGKPALAAEMTMLCPGKPPCRRHFIIEDGLLSVAP
jgi:hypothetical protein